MQAAILCLAIVAYGDTSDYIPASAATTATNVRNQNSEFAAGQARRHMDSSAADRQQQLDRQFRQSRNALPKPLNYGGGDFQSGYPIRTVGTDTRQNAAGTVNAAQFQFEDAWPNRPMDNSGYDKKPTANDSTDANSQRPFSLARPNTSQPEAITDNQTAQNTAPRKRYIPANAGSQYSPSPANDRINSTTASARPQYVSNDVNGPLGQSSSAPKPGEFGFTGNQPHEPATLNPIDQPPPANFGRQQPQSPQSNGYLPSNPQSTNTGVAGQRSGNKYLPPSSSAFGTTQSPQTTATPTQPTPQSWPPLAQKPPNPAFSSDTRSPESTETPSAESQIGNTGPAFRPVATPTNRIATSGADTTQPSQTTSGTYQRNPQDVRGGNFMTLLALFGSIGLNLYLGWIAWDTYNRYQDLVADIRYTSPRREPLRDEYIERVA